MGVGGVVWVAPALALGAYPSPHVVGVAHLFTLGWLTTSIMGALYQFLPVALGQPIASERVAHLSFALHVTGVAALSPASCSGAGRAAVGHHVLGTGSSCSSPTWA